MTISSRPVGLTADTTYQRAQRTIGITRKYYTPKRAYREILEAMFQTPLEQADIRGAYAAEAARLIFTIGQGALYDSLPYTQKARGLFSDAVRFYEASFSGEVPTEELLQCKLGLVKTTLIVMEANECDQDYWKLFEDALDHMQFVIRYGERKVFKETEDEIRSIMLNGPDWKEWSIGNIDRLRSIGQFRESREYFEWLVAITDVYGINIQLPKEWKIPPPSWKQLTD